MAFYVLELYMVPNPCPTIATAKKRFLYAYSRGGGVLLWIIRKLATLDAFDYTITYMQDHVRLHTILANKFDKDIMPI